MTKPKNRRSSKTTDSQYQSISGNWRKYLSRLCHRSKARSSRFTTEDLMVVLGNQGYRCALSGVPMTCILKRGTKCKTNASIDRIDAGADYSLDNIQLVCSALNSWRSDTELPEFIWFCKRVAEYNRDVN